MIRRYRENKRIRRRLAALVDHDRRPPIRVEAVQVIRAEGMVYRLSIDGHGQYTSIAARQVLEDRGLSRFTASAMVHAALNRAAWNNPRGLLI